MTFGHRWRKTSVKAQAVLKAIMAVQPAIRLIDDGGISSTLLRRIYSSAEREATLNFMVP
jgi:hypothetical protein